MRMMASSEGYCLCNNLQLLADFYMFHPQLLAQEQSCGEYSIAITVAFYIVDTVLKQNVNII